MTERIVLADRLDTAGAVALAAELSRAPVDGHVILDATGVTHFGAQAVQVVISAAKTLKGGGGTLECSGISDRAATHLAAMGLSFDELPEGVQ